MKLLRKEINFNRRECQIHYVFSGDHLLLDGPILTTAPIKLMHAILVFAAIQCSISVDVSHL